METLAADVAALLDALGIERAALIGHSMGGYVALAFARMFTERVSRLALVASRLRADTPEEAAARRELADRVEREAERSSRSSTTILPRCTGARNAREHARRRRTRVRESPGKTSRPGAAAMLRGMALRAASDDIAEDLRRSDADGCRRARSRSFRLRRGAGRSRGVSRGADSSSARRAATFRCWRSRTA